MADYRLYCVDGVGKINAAPELIDARTDDEAIVLARSKRLVVSSELWDRNRLVAKIAPYGSQ